MATMERTTDPTIDRPVEGEGLGGAARQAADTVAGAAGEMTARLPEVAQNAKMAVTEANRFVQRGSDTTIRLLGAASVGFALGLLVGGANRLLVLASLIPAALVGATMVERAESGTDAATRTSARVQRG